MFPFVYNELPNLFSEWERAERGIIIYRPKPKLFENENLQHFLGLSNKECNHLFIPTFQSVQDYGGQELFVDATPEQVAGNIEIFLKMQLDRKYKNLHRRGQ